MSKYTKEPWGINKTLEMICDTDGENITSTPENLRRIVACVNACAGIPNEVLELDRPQFVATLKQRYELARLLHAFLGIDDWADESIAPAELITETRAALAALEGLTLEVST